MASSRWSKGLRAIALFEVAKGLVGVWAAKVLISDGQTAVEKLSGKLLHLLHLEGSEGLGQWILNSAQNVNVNMLIVFAFAYVTVRFVEAYGLWLERRWAEWFAAISAGLYLPFELWAVINHAGPIKLILLGANIGIVSFLVKVIVRNRKARTVTGQADQQGQA
jgi:uncharacterized membrane protein (DUF2068 family)